MAFRTLLILFLLPVASTYANPYTMSGNVFDILAVRPDASEAQLEQSYRELIQMHASDPVALKILEYAKLRVRLIRGWDSIGKARIMSWEGISGIPYRSDGDLFNIYHKQLDDDHKQSLLHAILIPGDKGSARNLAVLNLSDGEDFNTLLGPIGDLDSFNRSLARDLVVFSNRLTDDPSKSPSDMLFGLLVTTVSGGRSTELTRADLGPLAGLILDVARRLPQPERQKFFGQIESWLSWMLPLTIMANATPIYFNPDRERILRQLRNWLSTRWPKPPSTRTSSACARLLGRID